jgi:uncharacterized protein (TIGR02284 family)
MFSIALSEAELFIELNRLIHAALDTRTKLLACALQTGSQAIRSIARNSAGALSTAAHELADLIRKLGGAPVDASAAHVAVQPLPHAGERALLVQCEQAIGQVACQYRDALEWSLPDAARETLMRQFSALIAHYERVRNLLECAEHGAARPAGRRGGAARCARVTHH